MTIHIPACPTCGMQVYRTKPETDDIRPSGLYGHTGAVAVRTMVTAILAEPCGHVMSGVITMEDDGCRYRFEFRGDVWYPNQAVPSDYDYEYVGMADAAHPKSGWYAIDPRDHLDMIRIEFGAS